MKWFVSQWPYLIEEAAIAPDITGSGVLAIVKGLWSCPLNWNHPSMGNIVVFMLKILRKTKISDLWWLHKFYCAVVQIQILPCRFHFQILEYSLQPDLDEHTALRISIPCPGQFDEYSLAVKHPIYCAPDDNIWCTLSNI